MTTNQQVREKVTNAYAKAVSRPANQGGSCCSPAQKGVAAKLAGYTSEEIENLPPDAVVNSFGCGNPLAFIEVKEGEVVVDLGSGAGIDILLAAKKVGPTGRVIGIDMTDEMIARANENIGASGLANVEVRKGIIEKLPVESSSVDWVISNCVINLSPEKPKVFAEIARVLKPGGRMLVSDIVVEELPDWVRHNEALYNSCVAGAISEEEYLAGLREAGLADVEVKERIVYDAAQLDVFISSELEDTGLAEKLEAPACCGTPPGDGSASGLATAMTGKIWSAKVHARKA
jgi:SAM-dependent methyltransferase